MVLDFLMPEGRHTFEELVNLSDVVLSNYRPAVVRKLGLEYATLGKINPRIICCNISGYGLEGKDIERPAYDLVIQAVSGMMSVTGAEGTPPVPAGMAIADEKGGIMATLGILAAYIKRQQDGRGQQVDISMFDNLLLSFSYSAFKYYSTGHVPGQLGSSTSGDKRADFRAYQTKDGYFVVGSGRGNDKWRTFCRVLGLNELGMEPRYDTYEKRIRDDARTKLERIFEPVFRTKTTGEWETLFSEADIPCAPVNSLDRALAKAEAQNRGMILEYPLPSGGTGRGIASPVKIGTVENLNPPPRFGEHTKDILTHRLNYSEARIQELAEKKVIVLGK
jgi:crotonobetainyl-CoA:carnitine CoA-transferase CaiB-like acyl-CoA transferase